MIRMGTTCSLGEARGKGEEMTRVNGDSGVLETFRTDLAGMSPVRPGATASRKRVLRFEGNRSGEA